MYGLVAAASVQKLFSNGGVDGWTGDPTVWVGFRQGIFAGGKKHQWVSVLCKSPWVNLNH